MTGLTTYISGSISINGVEIATYWEDGVDTQCTDGRFNARGNSIVADGDDVYMAGYECNASGIRVAKYWKNNQEVVLSNGTGNATVLSIVVRGGIVYAAGVDASEGGAVYWKNGVAVRLEANTGSEANSIFVTEDGVHVVGTDISKGAVYWKNGVANVLAGSRADRACSIFISEKNTYVVGVSGNPTRYSGAICWKNGVASKLTENAGSVNAVCCWHGNVYMAGRMEKDGKEVSVYWKNGVVIELPDLVLTDNSHNISVVYNHVYMALNGSDARGRNIGKCWINGEITDLTKVVPSLATGIFVL